ncbi:Alpha/Beta hydrolase protein [Tricladium varicosporioides]|nr:Alpha/Beta hydrolase protein [Hymenoscyphus varicosporioides]
MLRLLSLVAFLAFSTASRDQRICVDYLIPVKPTSTNFIWARPFNHNYDVVDFLSDAASRTADTDLNPFSGVKNQSASYKISATFCSPRSGVVDKKTVLLLSHGLNFDRSYWEPDVSPEKYSFVDWAIAKGYSVFFYDRLGVGKSSPVSGYINQASIQVSVLEEISQAIKSGKYTGSLGKPKSLVLVGHSFGSIISCAAVTASPDLADGLILTGFSFNGTNGAGFLEAFQPRIASGEDPKWQALDSGYLTAVDIFSNINVFFKAPDYDINIAKYAHKNRQPFAINEAISGTLVDLKAFEFRGPAMVIAGQYDLIFCTGQCDAVIQHPAQEIFSKAKSFKAISYPGAGHGLNFASNATGAFAAITGFLHESGL